YKGAASDRGARATYGGQVQNAGLNTGIGPNAIRAVAAGARFGTMFVAGDVVEFAAPPAPGTQFPPVRRTVVAVKDQTPVGTAGTLTDLLELDAPLAAENSPAILTRLSDAEADGFPFLADASD